MGWDTVRNDSRYGQLDAGRKIEVQRRWFDDNIKTDNRYSPENDEKLRSNIFGKEDVVAIDVPEPTLGDRLRPVIDRVSPVLDFAKEKAQDVGNMYSDAKSGLASTLLKAAGTTLPGMTARTIAGEQVPGFNEGVGLAMRGVGTLAYPAFEIPVAIKDAYVASQTGQSIPKAISGIERHAVKELYPKYITETKLGGDKKLPLSAGIIGIPAAYGNIGNVIDTVEIMGEFALANRMRALGSKANELIKTPEMQGKLEGLQYRIKKLFGINQPSALIRLSPEQQGEILLKRLKSGEIGKKQLTQEYPVAKKGLEAARLKAEFEIRRKTMRPESAAKRGLELDVIKRQKALASYKEELEPSGKVFRMRGEKAPKIRKKKPAKTFLGKIRQEGGIDPASARAAGYNIQEDCHQSGLLSALRKGGLKADDYAGELVNSGELMLQGNETPVEGLIRKLKEEKGMFLEEAKQLETDYDAEYNKAAEKKIAEAPQGGPDGKETTKATQAEVLAEEAKKYKTAEEFIENNHHTSVEDGNLLDSWKGDFVTENDPSSKGNAFKEWELFTEKKLTDIWNKAQEVAKKPLTNAVKGNKAVSSMDPEIKTIMDKMKGEGKVTEKEYAEMMKPDVWSGLKTGQKATLSAYRGTGRADISSVYADGVEGAALGDGKYHALNKEYAKKFGKEVTESKITLENPYVINSTKDLQQLAGQDIPYANKDRIPILGKIRKEIQKLGHDGIIVNVPKQADVDSAGNSVKRLREIFDESQVIVFRKGLPAHLQKIADKAKGITDVTPKGYSPTPSGTASSLPSKTAQKKIPIQKGISPSAGAEPISKFEPIKGEAKKDYKLSEEVKKVAKKYIYRIGEKYNPPKTTGAYYVRPETALIGAMNDVSTVAHEVTHHLDKKAGIAKGLTNVTGTAKNGYPIYDKTTRKYRKVFTDIYVNHYPGAKKWHRLEKRMQEGIATAIQKYIEQPTMMKKTYPLAYEYIMGGDYPIVNGLVRDLRKVVADYQSLSPHEKTKARLFNSKKKDVAGSYFTLMDKIKTETLDLIFPIVKLAKQAGVEMTKADPSIRFRTIRYVVRYAQNNMTAGKGYISFDTDFNPVKKLKFNWGDLTKKVSDSGMGEDFGTFLINRRQHFAYTDLGERLKNLPEQIKELEEIIANKKESLIPGDKNRERELITEIEETKNMNQMLKRDGFSKEEVAEAYNEFKEVFKEETKQFDALVKEDLVLLRNARILSPKAYGGMAENEGYATMKRVAFNDIVGEADAPVGLPVRTSGVSSLKKRTGSMLDIENPLFASVKNHIEILKKASKQFVYNGMLEVVDSFPGLFTKLGSYKNKKYIPAKYTDENIILAKDKKYNYVPILTDKYLKGVIDEAVTPQSMHVFEKAYLKASSIFTKGTTAMYPMFAVSNLLMDNISATGQTVTKFKPLIDPIRKLYKRLFDIDSEDAKYYREYLDYVGDMHTYLTIYDKDPQQFFNWVTKERNFLQKYTVDLLDKGGDILAYPSKQSEIMTRAVEYINARKQGDPAGVALEKAGQMTASFHHIGRWGGQYGRSAIKGIPFLPASVQALNSFGRRVADPKTRKRVLFTMLAISSAIVGSGLYTRSQGTKKQKEMYKDMHPNELALYLIAPHINGKDLYKFRIPQEYGTAGQLINMMMGDMLFNTKYKPSEYLDMATSWIPDQFNFTDPVRQMFSSLPQFLKPAVETGMGKRTFPKVIPIETMGDKNLPPEFRYNIHTAEMYKQIGKLFKISPKLSEHLIRGYLGRFTDLFSGRGYKNPIKKEWYFTSGRRLVEYYNYREKVSQGKSAYRKGLVDGFEERNLAYIKGIDKRLKVYRDVEQSYLKAKKEKNKKLEAKKMDEMDSWRTEILDLIDKMEI